MNLRNCQIIIFFIKYDERKIKIKDLMDDWNIKVDALENLKKQVK